MSELSHCPICGKYLPLPSPGGIRRTRCADRKRCEERAERRSLPGQAMNAGPDVVVPLRTISAGNSREHWRDRAKRVKAERAAIALLWPRDWRRRKWRFPLEVTLERHAPSEGLDPGDNLPMALKSCRDEVARLLGVDDRDARVCWAYAQARGPYAVVIGVRELQP